MLRAKVLSPFAIVVACISVALLLVAVSPAVRAHVNANTCNASGPCPPPAPTPTPTGAFLTLDVTAGGNTTTITVSGSSFLPNEATSIYWDTKGKVIGSATADRNGNFVNVHVKPFAGDPPGLHLICAGVNPFPCAQFELQGTPSPTPSAPASPSESPSPSATESPSPSGSPTPAAIVVPPVSGNGLDFLVRPPFVFLPILALLGLLVAIVFWFLGASGRRQQSPLPTAAIVHRSVRPAYGPAVFDVAAPPPAASAATVEQPSAPPSAPDAPVDIEQPPWPAVDQARPAWLANEPQSETDFPPVEPDPSGQPPDAPLPEDYWPPV